MPKPNELFSAASAIDRMREYNAKHGEVHPQPMQLSSMEVQSLLNAINELHLYELDKDPETHRREQPSMPTTPVPGLTYDYAQAGTLIDKAMHHLDEGLPTGQRRRCETAFTMLRDGVFALEKWMRAVGYRV